MIIESIHKIHSKLKRDENEMAPYEPYVIVIVMTYPAGGVQYVCCVLWSV